MPLYVAHIESGFCNVYYVLLISIKDYILCALREREVLMLLAGKVIGSNWIMLYGHIVSGFISVADFDE